MRKLRVYLAGRFMKHDRCPHGHPDWRDCVKDKVQWRLQESGLNKEREIEFHDPRYDTAQGKGFAYFNHGDREGVLSCNVLFFFDATPDGKQEDPGGVSEATIGVENSKVVIYCTEMSVIHPMFGNYCSGAIAIGLDAGVDWIISFAKHGLASFEAYHEMIESRKRLSFS